MHRVPTAALLVCLFALASPHTSRAAKHDKWFEARSQNFVIVCNAGDKQARKTAVQFEQIRALFRKYLEIASEHPTPVITIMAAKDENSLKELLPEYWATKGHTHPAGIYFTALEQHEIALMLDAPGQNPYETVYHEYYHSLTIPYMPNLPVWIAEGLADFFGNSQVVGDKAYMGEPDDGLIYELRQNSLIPLNVLFNVDHSSPYYNESAKTSIFYAESWALIHYLMLGDKQAHRSMLLAYLTALGQGATSEQAAEKSFGDLKQLQKALSRYIDGSQFYSLNAPAPAVPETDIKVRELTDAEADAYLGAFQAIRQHPQEAEPLLQEAIQMEPNLAMAYEYLGVAQLFSGDRSAAFASFSKAVSIDPKNALTRYFRAYLSVGQSDRLTGNDSQVEEDLRQAIAVDPNFTPPYGMLATYLAATGENLQDALKFAQKAVSLEPGDSNSLLAYAQVLARMKKFDQAQSVALVAQSAATNPGQRSNAASFLNYLQQMRAYESHSGQPNGAFSTGGPLSRSPNSDEAANTSKSGPEQHTVGVITQSSCAGGSPVIEVQNSGGGSIVLHIAPGAALDIKLSFNPPSGFSPCKLSGYRASASFTPDDASGKRGTLTALRVLGPSATNADDATAQVDEDKTPSSSDSATSSENPTHGSPVEAEGQATDVTCNGNEMFVKVTTDKRQYTLHARNYGDLTYYDDHSGPNDQGFLPCKDLKGRTVSIIFILGEHRRWDGEIQSVEIEK
jgi:tetratricopeptide (TPR) repeat protein